MQSSQLLQNNLQQPVVIIYANPNVQWVQPGLICLVTPIEHSGDCRHVHRLNVQMCAPKTVNKLRSIRDINNDAKNDETHASSNFDVGLALFKNCWFSPFVARRGIEPLLPE